MSDGQSWWVAAASRGLTQRRLCTITFNQCWKEPNCRFGREPYVQLKAQLSQRMHMGRDAGGADGNSADGGGGGAVCGGVADVGEAGAAVRRHLPLLRPRQGLACSRERQRQQERPWP